MKKKVREPRYNLVAVYVGYDTDKDKMIRKIVGRDNNGSGFGFGERDLGFSFFTKPAAERAKARLRQKRIRTYIYDRKDLDK